MSVRDLIILGSSSQQPTRLRNHNGYLVRWNGHGFLFDPGEGTQRQFMHASVSPTTTTHIFISHFHGDHCLGLPSMLMRFNLDKISHPIHLIFPASGKRYLDRLRFCASYHDNLDIRLYPISSDGLFMEDEFFRYYAYELNHPIQTYGYRIEEKDKRRFNPQLLQQKGIKGPLVGTLFKEGIIEKDGQTTRLEEVSYLQQGDILGVALDTGLCNGLNLVAKDASLFLCESTYLDEHKELALAYHHLTARQAAHLAATLGAKKLVLTHFSARYMDTAPIFEEASLLFPNVHIAQDGDCIAFGKSRSNEQSL